MLKCRAPTASSYYQVPDEGEIISPYIKFNTGFHHHECLAQPQFGMKPKQATGSSEITFIPGDPEVLVWYGNWWIVPIILEHL